MGFPLIQQPAPLQQLSDTIAQIRARREAATQAQFERDQGKAQTIRGDAYLALNQQEAADRQKRDALNYGIQQQQLALTRALTGAQIQNYASEALTRQQTAKQALLKLVLDNAPPGTSVELWRAQQEASGNKFLPSAGGTAPETINQTYQRLATQAAQQGLYGRQGSAVRDAVPLTSNGVTFTPGTKNYNASEGAGNGRIPQPALRAASNSFAAESADKEMRAIESAPNGQRVMREVANYIALPTVGRLVPGGIGGGVEGLLRNARAAGLSPTAQRYLKRMYDFSSLAGPVRYGRSFRTEVMLQQMWSDFGAGQYGVSGEGIGATQTNRANAVNQMRAEAGPDALHQAQQYFTPQPGQPNPGTPGGLNPRFISPDSVRVP